MNTEQTSNFYVVIWFISYIYLIRGEPYWIVNAKVSGYGENLTLFCLVNDCCNEAAGWIKFDPDYKTIYLDVRDSTNYTSKDKYAANTNSSGFSLVIKNIQKEDINIGYSCVYGFDKSRKKVLLQSDAFRDDEIIFPVAGIIGLIIVLVIILVLAGIFLYFWIFKRKRFSESSKRNNGAGASMFKGKEDSIELENNTTTLTVAESSKTDNGAGVYLLQEREDCIELENNTTTLTVAESSKTDNDAGVYLLQEKEDCIELENNTTTLTVAESSKIDHGTCVNVLKEKENRKVLVNGTSTLTADIVIIHTDCNYIKNGVKSFKFHLEKLSRGKEHRDINIKLVEEVCPSVVDIQTVLEKCKYVFVYISWNICEKERYGNYELLIRNALDNQNNNEYIKIVSNCGKWHLKTLSVNPENVFLDYYCYKSLPSGDKMNENYKRKFEDIIKKCVEPL